MSYKKSDIPVMIHAFWFAGKQPNLHEGVCVALAELRGQGVIAPETLQLCLSMIREILAGRDGNYTHSYLEHWMRRARAPQQATRRKLRLLWIDKIISDLQEYAK